MFWLDATLLASLPMLPFWRYEKSCMILSIRQTFGETRFDKITTQKKTAAKETILLAPYAIDYE